MTCPAENLTALADTMPASSADLHLLLAGEVRSVAGGTSEANDIHPMDPASAESQSSTIVTGSLPRFGRLHSASRQLYADRWEVLALESGAKTAHLLVAGREGSRSVRSQRWQSRTLPSRSHSQDHIGSFRFDERAEGILPALQMEESGQRLPKAREHPVLLVVDQRITMLYGSKRYAKSVVAAKAAALLAWRALASEKRVGAIIFDDRKIVQLRPQCSRLRVRLILHAILTQNHALSPLAIARSNLGMLDEVLRRTARFTSNSLMVLITDASGCSEKTSCLVKDLCKKNNVLVALVYDPRQMDSRDTRPFCADHSPSRSGIGRRDHRGNDLFNGPLEPQSRIGRGLFPGEVPIVPLSTHNEVAAKLLQFWGKVSAPPPSAIAASMPSTGRLRRQKQRR